VTKGSTIRRLLVAAFACSLAAAATFVSAAGAATDARVWTLVSPPVSPPARAGHSMAYDPVGKQVLVFGGYDDVGYLNDTWTWNEVTWTQQAPATSPAPRAGAGIAFDRVTHQLVMFGGFTGSGYLGDTWTWDGSTSSWTRRTTATRPPKVSGPMLFTDPVTGHVDMFGGFDGMFFQNVTWQWTGTDWLNLHPASSPTARGAAIAQLDSANQTVVMFSGIADLNAYDTWTWDGVTWTRQSPVHQPPSRFYSSSAYEPSLGAVVIFGGGSGNGDLHDTWEWNGTDWMQLQAGAPPAKRESQGMAFDPANRRLVMFGGQVSGLVVDDTWTL
jgi:Kelch motif protein/galactose oxidase-like protein